MGKNTSDMTDMGLSLNLQATFGYYKIEMEIAQLMTGDIS